MFYDVMVTVGMCFPVQHLLSKLGEALATTVVDVAGTGAGVVVVVETENISRPSSDSIIVNMVFPFVGMTLRKPKAETLDA
jgi:hypothetical protein